MTRIVEMQYNPYLPQLRILIDGYCLSDYSKLIQYTDEDIWHWQDKILADVYRELRENFSIRFIGRNCDAEIMAFRCENNPYCIDFMALPFEREVSLQTRLGKLNQILLKRKENKFVKTSINAYFIIGSELDVDREEICMLDIRNEFCCVYPKIIDTIISFEEGEDNYLFVIADTIERAEFLMKNAKGNNPIFVIIKGERTGLHTVNESSYIYEAENEFLISVILDCFLNRPLVQALKKCFISLSETLKKDEEVQRLMSVQPVLKVIVDEIIEIGKNYHIQLVSDLEESNSYRVEYKIQDTSIATINGNYLRGKIPGSTLLEVYYYGETCPFFVKEIRIIKRNRIKQLIMDEDSIVMGAGDQRKLYVEYFPKNADNTDTILWKSTNDSVIEIDNTGMARAVGIGNCRVICCAENVSVETICQVKPYLKDISINVPKDENGILQMKTGDEIPLHISIFPENCIDGKLVIHSSQPDIVNVANGILYGKKAGTAVVKVGNERKKQELSVRVISTIPEEKKEVKKKGFWRIFLDGLFS